MTMARIPDASDIPLHFDDPDVIPGPDERWWAGRTSCSICGYGTSDHEILVVVSAIAIPAGQDAPVVAMECPSCRNFTLSPVEEPE
jgi:hypothetical protein